MLIIANITGIIYTLKHILRTIIENPKTEISFEMKSSEMKYHFQPAIKALTIFSHWRTLQCLHFPIAKNMKVKTLQWDEHFLRHCCHLRSLDFDLLRSSVIFALRFASSTNSTVRRQIKIRGSQITTMPSKLTLLLYQKSQVVKTFKLDLREFMFIEKYCFNACNEFEKGMFLYL